MAVKTVKKKYFGVGLQVVVEDASRDGQVPSAEGVFVVPPLGAKFTAFSNTSMKEAEREEHGVELLLFGTLIQSVLKQKRKGKVMNAHKKRSSFFLSFLPFLFLILNTLD